VSLPFVNSCGKRLQQGGGKGQEKVREQEMLKRGKKKLLTVWGGNGTKREKTVESGNPRIERERSQH
jgi:hypothetical protein